MVRTIRTFMALHVWRAVLTMTRRAEVAHAVIGVNLHKRLRIAD